MGLQVEKGSLDTMSVVCRGSERRQENICDSLICGKWARLYDVFEDSVFNTNELRLELE